MGTVRRSVMASDGEWVRLREARGLLRWWLRRGGYAAITLPPLGIFAIAERIDDAALQRHELEHWRQAREMGWPVFFVVYLWLLARHGYWNHPMEIEARKAEGTDR